MSHKEDVLARLDRLGVPHETWHHEAAFTMEACYALPFASPEVMICKNILLCNRQQTAFYLYITPAFKRFRTADVSKLLGVSRLSFAPEEKLLPMLGVTSGSLSPFALWYDQDRLITFAADEAVRTTPRIAFHPCDNTATVVFTQEDFWDGVIPALRRPLMLRVPEPPAE